MACKASWSFAFTAAVNAATASSGVENILAVLVSWADKGRANASIKMLIAPKTELNFKFDFIGELLLLHVRHHRHHRGWLRRDCWNCARRNRCPRRRTRYPVNRLL